MAINKNFIPVRLKIDDGRPFVPDEWLDGVGREYGTETCTRPEYAIVANKVTSQSCWRVHYRMWNQEYDNYFLHGKWEIVENGLPCIHVWEINKNGKD